ncbi:MAG: hypothetical protein WD645_06465 [Dehalococcoidia bacterium]
MIIHNWARLGPFARFRAYTDLIEASSMTPTERHTLLTIALAVRWNDDQQEYYESNGNLADRLGLTGKNARKHAGDRIAAVRDKGYLTVLEAERGKTVRYALDLPPVGVGGFQVLARGMGSVQVVG